MAPVASGAGAFALAAPAAAQVAAAAPASAALASPPDSVVPVRRVVTPGDYGRFETLGATAFSPDARWVSVVVSRFDADGEVRLLPVDGGDPRVFEKAIRADFAPEGRWAAVVTGPGLEERRRLQENRTPARNDLILVNLEAGEEENQHLREVQSFAFSPDGRWILIRRHAPAPVSVPASANGTRDNRGVDILVRELATGTVTNFGNVSESAWADEGSLLAMVVDAHGQAGNGVRLFDPAAGTLRTLHAEEARFHGLTWREGSRDLALFRVDPDPVRGDTVRAILAWRNLGQDAGQAGATPAVLAGAHGAHGAHGANGAVMGDWRTTEARGLRWAKEGERLYFAVQARVPDESDASDASDMPDADPASEPDATDDPSNRVDVAGDTTGRRSGPDSVPGVEIWHARDVDPVPQQRLRANEERDRSAMASWPLAGEPVVLGGDGAGESLALLPGERHALILDDEPWGPDRMFGPVYRDAWVVDVATGIRTLVRERVEFAPTASPSGRYLLLFEADHWHVHDLERGETRNLTSGLEAVFTNEQVDVLVPQKPPYGAGGWTEGDRHVLLYDRHDVWRVRPDGSGGERLTRGAEDEIRHRLVRLDPDQDAWPAGGPWTVSLFGEWTKRSGWGELRPGREVERLAFEDRALSRLQRSEDGARSLWISQRYDDPPTLHLGDARLGGTRGLDQANAFMRQEFLWGRSELLDFVNGWGVPLQATLHYPADFEPGRSYPMVVYHYERLSQGLHTWVNPSDRSAYNITAYTQNGYFVLQPDIVYRPRNPGLSAMASFNPALDAALATGHIDPARIGIMGHSWGGYQTTFAVTQTDRFAAAVAGAPLTNLISMYLSFYWNSGSTDARIFEISQGRMEVPWWEDYESYVANSPVHHIQRMNTPLLMAFGTDDGAVEFNQGVEFYNAARRAGKDFVLLVYEGENHSLARRPNQVDYHRRSLEWFDHYLKGAPAPAWITEGVPFLDQEENRRRGPAAGRVRAVPPSG